MQPYPSGTLIANRYEVGGRPLIGGMDIVYLCFDHLKDRPVSLKTFRPEYLADRAARDRFLREGTTWVDLDRHPHVVQAYGFNRSDNGQEVYLELELVARKEGHLDASLRAWLTPGQPLPLEQALLFALPITRIMQHDTTKISGFVHRDLKPENVLVGVDRLTGMDTNRLRVTDFGLANVLRMPGGEGKTINSNSSGRTHLTQGFVGTPLYMAPEQ